MPQPQLLLHQIAGMTAHRDLDLIEFSVLRGVEHIAGPDSLRILRCNDGPQPTQELSCRDQQYQISQPDLSADSPLLTALARMHRDELETQTIEDEDGISSLFLMRQSPHDCTFLALRTARTLPTEKLLMLEGMLEIYRNYTNLLMLSQTDPLTGLLNRQTFEEAISKQFERPRRATGPDRADTPGITAERRSDAPPSQPWLAMLDIDHFKSINDRFGHLYGDEVLVLLGQLLRQELRHEDQLFRFGGEEFAIIFHTGGHDDCLATLERVRQRVAEHDFPRVGKVTVSIGCVAIEPGVFHATLLDYADQALYQSKRNGRNQVSMFEDLLAQGLAHREEVEAGEVALF